jgi:acyl carrier protein
VREAAVIAREDAPGDKRLIAYYTPSAAGAQETDAAGAKEFRLHLSASLPEYMIPAAYVRLESLPLTPNGKLDRKALPAPEVDSYSTRCYEPPEDETEQKIAGIWQDVLNFTPVGRDDNFFDLGGNSIRLMSVHSRLRQAFDKDISMVDLFRFATVRALAQNLAGKPDSNLTDRREVEGNVRKDGIERRRRLRQQVAMSSK